MTDLWTSIQYIDSHPDLDIMERVLSMKLFLNSKRFETVVRAKLLSILRKYLDPDHLCENDEGLLRQIGIVKYPEHFEFCGGLVFENSFGEANFSAMMYGSSISISDLTNGEIKLSSYIKNVISIENKANYIHYIAKMKSDDELVLYHAGQYSPSKKKFFLAISKAMPKDCQWYHWGDIDYGGFCMLLRLRKEINHSVKPLKMSRLELENYDNYCRKITENYTNKLVSLMKMPEMADCRDCLNYMAESRKRLEQEALLLER